MKKFWVSLLALMLIGALFAMGMAEGLEIETDDFEEVTDDSFDTFEDIYFEEEPEEEDEFLIGGDETESEMAAGYADFVWDGEDHDSDYAVSAVVYNVYTVQGKQVAANSVSSPGNGQCWAYANSMYAIIWGQGFNESSFIGVPGTGYNMLRNLSQSDRTLTADHIRLAPSQSPSPLRRTKMPRPRSRLT